MIVTVIGRGHSGTRAMSHTLSESGVYMGGSLNASGDLVPADDLYEACRVFARSVRHLGGLHWDFSKAHEGPIDPAFARLVDSYLASVLESDAPLKGWKLPETTLILPWIVRMFPEVRFVYWYRDPRDSILGGHLTDDLADFGIPYEPTGDPLRRRAISWQYQYEIMRTTPFPAHRIEVRFEEFVLDQEATLRRLEAFLGVPLARIPVRPESVGRWRSVPEAEPYAIFPAETLYEGVLEAVQR
ncbi:MAG TPA: sulfotransferase [Fimbriimonas sp.]